MRDVRYVARALVREPGFFLVTALTLALGIGATTAIFSVVNGVLLAPLPYPASGRIVQLIPLNKAGERNSSSEPNFADWEERTRTFSSIAISGGPLTITANGLGEPIRARETTVTRSFFTVFGLAPQSGRTFANNEFTSSAGPAAVVSHGFAEEHLGGARAAVGRTMNIGSRLVTVIGVMPPAMDYPAGTGIWLPHLNEEINHSRTSGGWRVIARLRGDMSLAQARQDLREVTHRMKAQYGDETVMSDADALPLRDYLIGNVRTTLWVLLGASAFLLLIACANVVNLLLARMSVRRGEIGVRLALGASTARLARQFLTESALLALAGGAAGVIVAAAGVRALVALQNGKLPRAGEVHLSVPVLLVAVGVSLLAALALGLITAWQGTRGDVRDALSATQRTLAGSGSGARVRRSLVVSQMALTVVLLVGATLLGRSFVKLLQVDPGYRTEHAVVLDATVPEESDSGAARRRAAFYEELVARAAAIPGVSRAGAANGFPLLNGAADGTFLIMSSPTEKIAFDQWPERARDPATSGTANFLVVDGEYFDAMGIPLLRGRVFRAGDSFDAPHVAVISASLAKSKWQDHDPLGRTIQFGNMDGDLRPFTVVGVVGDVRDENLASPPQPTFYAYLRQRPHAAWEMHVVMRTDGDPSPVSIAAVALVRRLRPDVPTAVRTIETLVSTSVADRKFALLLSAAFGAAALLLATLGVYSVVSYLVTQRNREIGVRIAFGAQTRDVLRLVLEQGAWLSLLGIAVGSIGALSLTRLLSGLVFGISTTDPIAFLAVIALLAAVALLASLLPARRATRIDPMTILRQ